MRRFIIVEEHGKLPFPEGTACAEILKAGEKKEKSARMALVGVVISSLYKVGTSALFLWKGIPTWTFSFFQNTVFSIDTSPALLGVGYIIGPQIASLMFAGGAIAWWVFIPLIKMFGGGTGLIYPAQEAISQMTSTEIWSNYVRYIGAGTVATGGIFSLFRIAPLFYRTIHISIQELFSGFKVRARTARVDRDISMAYLLLGPLAIIWLF